MAPHDLVNAIWRKSTRSGGQGECVELASIQNALVIRDSKNPHSGVLTLNAIERQTFTTRIKRGLLDRRARPQGD
jgi:Domain of unknown function (DUF397)